MNENHACCSSPEWATFLQSEVLAPLAASVDLGDELLELGPGPGAATSWLCRRVKRLLAIELDPEAAERLRREHEDSNVEVRVGDSSRTGLDPECVDSVASFTMLHHLPTPALQHATLAEAHRVLRPGGVLIGADSLASQGLHEFHEADTYNPVDPARLMVWLQVCGFAKVSVTAGEGLVFSAWKAAP